MAQREKARRTLTALTLAGVVGMAATAFAQPQEREQGGENQGGLVGDEQRPVVVQETQPAEPGREGDEGEEQPAPNPRLQEAWQRFRDAGGTETQPPTEEVQPVAPVTPRRPSRIGGAGEGAIDLIPEEGEAGQQVEEGPVSPDTVFRLPAFSEPVQLQSLVDWISRRLQVNIFTDPALGDRSVVFNGPLEVRADELLDLLSLLLEQQGFVLVQSREGWYSIRQSADAPVSFGDGELATTRVIATPLLRPSSLKPAIDTALGSGNAGGSARIAYIDELAMIIMTDRPSSLRAVERIVRAVVDAQTSMDLRRFELVNLSASVARDKVVELNNLGASGGQARTQTAQQGSPQTAASAIGASSGGLSNLGDRLFVDSESNSLLFRGSESEAERVAQLVDLVDVPSKLFGRRYEAGPASPMIVDFGQSQGLGAVTQVSTGGGTFGQRGGFGTTAQSRLGNQQTQGISGARFALEDSQQAFVYFGTEAQHAQVETLVESFADQARGARVVVEFYKLRHANAESVAEILNALIEDPNQQLGQSPFLPSPVGVTQNRPVRRAVAEAIADGEVGEGEVDGLGLTYSEEIRIEADVDRNQVVIKAPQRQQREFARIIEKVDVRRPQVYVEAKIIAVSTGEDFRFAVQTLSTPGEAILFTNFGLAVPTGTGGATGLQAAIIPSGDEEYIINALTSNTSARIVSSPRILVNDNEEGSVESLREEPYSQTTQNASTQVTSQGGVAEAGTRLTVTPRISDAGMLNLEYEIELSSFDERTQEQIEAGLQPPKQTETYSGSVALPNDATIVVGGLSNQRDGETVDKIPLLGDLPLIGEMFRSTRKNTSANTIYVFIRPRILSEPNFSDLRLLTQGPRQDSKLEDDTPRLEPVRMPTLGLTLDRWRANRVEPRVSGGEQ